MQEAVVLPPIIALAVRPYPGIWEFVRANSDDLSVEDITMSDYLKYKESVYDERWYTWRVDFSLHGAAGSSIPHVRYSLAFCRAKDEDALEVDFSSFDSHVPRLTLPSSIGNGLQFIAKFLSSRLSQSPDESMKPLLDYLLALNHRGEVSSSRLPRSVETNGLLQ